MTSEKKFEFHCNIDLASVTLYSLGDPFVFRAARGANARPPITVPIHEVALPSKIMARLSALYCLFALAITPSRSLTIHLPKPDALVNVMPPPDDALRTCPLTLVSVALTVPIALFIECFVCLLLTYYKGIKERMGEPCASSPSVTTKCCC